MELKSDLDHYFVVLNYLTWICPNTKVSRCFWCLHTCVLMRENYMHLYSLFKPYPCHLFDKILTLHLPLITNVQSTGKSLCHDFCLQFWTWKSLEIWNKRKEMINEINYKPRCLRTKRNEWRYGGDRPYLPPYRTVLRPSDQTLQKSSQGRVLICIRRPPKT